MEVFEELRTAEGEIPTDGTVEWCQYMTALLVQVLNDESLKQPHRVTKMDIRRLAGSASQDASPDFDGDVGAHLANLRLLAVQEYKIRNGITD